MKYFYETRLEKNEGGGKVLAAKKKSVTRNSGQTLVHVIDKAIKKSPIKLSRSSIYLG